MGSIARSLSELEVRIEDVEFDQEQPAVSPAFRRVTTTVRLRGGGSEGLGEDVTYQPELHDRVPEPPVSGEWTSASSSGSLDGFAFFDSEPEGPAAFDYGRWAWESAALDLALGQAGLTLADVTGREPGPLTYVVSARVTRVWSLLEVDPTLRFKLDPASDWDERTIDRLAELDRVDTADFKGVFRGSFGQPPEPELYRRIAEAFPKAWLEDPGLDERTDEVLGPHRDRVQWDGAVYSVEVVGSMVV